MPWLPGMVSASSGRSAERDYLLQLERRVTLLEQRDVLPQDVTGDFLARPGETIFISAPTTGISGLLPAVSSRNRGALIRLVFRNNGPVTLRVDGGTINSQPSLVWSRVGAYTAVSDGLTGWWIQSPNYPRPRDWFIEDHFISGGLTSGIIGSLGWILGGAGTPAVTRPGTLTSSGSKIVLTTTAASNDRTSLVLDASETGASWRAGNVQLMQCIWNMNSNLTNKRVFFGFAERFDTAPASVANSLGIYLDTAINGNYQVIHRFGSTGSPTDTTVAVPSNTDQLVSLYLNGATWEFWVSGVRVGTVPNTLNSVALTPMNVGFRCETLTTAAKTVRVGYFGLRATGIVGAHDDDDQFRL